MIHITTHISKIIIVASGLLMLSLNWCITPLYAYEISLRQQVLVNDAYIYVRDIVNNHNNMPNDILNMTIAKAPRPGSSRQLSRAFIVMKLKNKNISTKNMSIDGAHFVRVERGICTIKEETIKAKVLDYLHDVYDLDVNGKKVILENIRNDISLAPGTYDIVIEDMESTFRNGKIRIWVVFMRDSVEVLRKAVSAEVLEKKSVVVAAQRVAARATLQASDLVNEERYVDYDGGCYVDIQDVVGKTTCITISEGDLISQKNVKNKPTIYRGDTVIASYRYKNMIVTLKLKALESGYVGETIKLYNNETKKQCMGTIKNSEEVEVVL